ncbi:MAG: N-acetylneuraminate synthase family protein [Acidobacteria bacterium]|nr:N-acetylneuraminate synthase family protein [Acidobacteriota bacterium]
MVVAEVAQAHDGSLGAAHAYVDAVARAGVDAVKFQTHIAAAESTPAEPWRVKFSPQDETRFDYWRRMEFTEPQWRGLANHARDLGIEFLSTPFSFEAVDLLHRLDVPAWKVGSGEVQNLALIAHIASTGKPVLLSSGMSSWEHLTDAVQVVREHGAPVAVFQCTAAYPCPPENVGLNLLDEIRRRYGCPVGLSDHSGTIYPGIAAAALGADLLEVHVVFSRDCHGPDTSASVTTDELRQLVQGVRAVGAMRAHPVDKDKTAAELADLRLIFGHSLVADRDLPAGHTLRREDIALKKPGTGVPAARVHTFVGRVLKRAIAADHFILENDVD